MIGGALACGLTHTAVCPLDIVKCRMQVNPGQYKSIGDAFTTIRATEGVKGLRLGWAPTLIGYSLQGLGKFGFYELFKDVFAGIVGPENAVQYRAIGFALSSASAEIIADVLLCPWEAVKVRVQTSTAGTFPTSLGAAMGKIRADEGMNGLYKGLSPLWARQIPYTVMKFVAFEKTVEAFYRHVFTKPKNEYSKGTQLSITFASGYIAGVLCALVSQPADTMVSKLNNMKTAGSTMDNVKKIYSDIGFKGLWRGMGTRIIMIGTLTGLQWWIYDSFKTMVGLQTTGGAPIKK
jgi:solute carrier family 25 phosphate transporter 3